MAMPDLPRGVSVVSRLLPSVERDAILGDLLEESGQRNLTGAHLHLWLALECGTVAAGLSVERLREACLIPALELAAALSRDGAHTFHDPRNGALPALVTVAIVSVSTALMVLSVGILVATLFSASGL